MLEALARRGSRVERGKIQAALGWSKAHAGIPRRRGRGKRTRTPIHGELRGMLAELNDQLIQGGFRTSGNHPQGVRRRRKRAMMKQWNNLRSPPWVRLWKRQRTLRRARAKVRIGAWNVRAIGAPHAQIGQMVKMRKLVRTWERRRWRAVCLSDVRWPIGEEAENSIGVRAFKGREGWWTIIHCGKVAIAL